MSRRIIGLAGRSGSGKDAVAEHISERFGYSKFAIADALKLEVYNELLDPSQKFLELLEVLGYAPPEAA